jgi:hypothetical protein
MLSRDTATGPGATTAGSCVFSLSGLVAPKSCPASWAYDDRKRGEGRTHVQAMLSLARRRLNVLRAMLRDGTTYTPVTAPTTRLAA